MFSVRKLISILFVSIALLAVLPVRAAEAVPRFEPSACPSPNNGSYTIDCGWLIAPENHAQPAGKTVRLAVAIIRTSNPNKAPDPIFYLAGGPGGAFVSIAPKAIYLLSLAPLLDERDVIIMDQRGMGLSQPKISCVPYDSALDFYSETFPPANFYDRIRQCRKAVEAQGINPALYTIEQNAADFASLRQALGYQQVNLFGVSWGTDLGQVILRDHPQGIRSAVLDSVLPTSANGFESLGQNFERSFAQFETACAGDFICRTAYPNLRQTFLDTYQRLQTAPLKLTVEGQQVTFTGKSFAGSVYVLLRDKAGVERLPGFITAVAGDDYTVLTPSIKPILQVAADKSQLPDHGPFLTMVCPQMAAPSSLENIQTALAPYPAAIQNADLYFGPVGYRMCAAWGMPASSNRKPAVSDVPALLLTGQFDPLTPPDWARQVARTLSRGRVYEFPSLGHGSSAAACPQQIMIAFLKNPLAQPDNTCAASITTPVFMVTLGVTRPFVQFGALLLAAIALFGLGSMSLALAHRQHPIAWRASLRRMGWLPLLATIAGLVIVLLNSKNLFPDDMKAVNAVQIVIPLALAIQAALIFSPDDEPGLEMLLALPRPIAWLILERFAVLLIAQTIIALAGAVVILALSPGQDVLILLLSWLPSALFLGGLSLYITLRSRLVMFGVVLAVFLWLIFALFNQFFLPGAGFPFPLNIIQPFFWAVHLHIAPADFAPADYWLNRFFISVLGIGFIMLGLREVHDSEYVLLQAGKRARRKSPTANTSADVRRPPIDLGVNITVHAVTTAVQPLRQIVGMAWYEFTMHRRRRAFKILTLIAVLCAGFIMLVIGGSLSTLTPGLRSLATMPPDQAYTVRGLSLVFLVVPVLLVLMTLLLPLLVVDTVPLDEQGRTAELLHSLPLPRTVYLAGKVLGVWLAALTSLTFSLISIGLFSRLTNGPFDPRPFADAGLTGILPLMLIAGGLGVLIGATQPSRGRALLALLGAWIGFALLAAVLNTTPLGCLLPGRIMPILDFYAGGALEGMIHNPPILPASGLAAPLITQTMLVGAAQLLAVALVVLRLNQRQSSR